MQQAKRWGGMAGVALAVAGLLGWAGVGFAQTDPEYQFAEIPGTGANHSLMRLDETGAAVGRTTVVPGQFQPTIFSTIPPYIERLPLGPDFPSGAAFDMNLWGEVVGSGQRNNSSFPLCWPGRNENPVAAGSTGTVGGAWVMTDDGRKYGWYQIGSRRVACQFLEAGAGVSAASRSALAVQSGTVQEIPTIPGTPWSEVHLGNNEGTIAGFAQIADGKEQRVWILRPGTPVKIITPFNGYPNGLAYAMQENGDLVGLMSTSLTLFQGFYIPFYYIAEADHLVYLGVPTGHRGVALDVATVNDRTFAVGYIERVDGTARFAARWEVEVQQATAGPHVAAAPTVRISQTYFQNRMAPAANGFVPQMAISINRRGQVLVAGRTREPKTVYGLLNPANGRGGSRVHYLPSDDVAPGQRTGVWCESVDAPDCRIFSRAKNDPKDVREEGKHGKDNPIPYDPNRLYRCEP